jgi:hypothetical protein
MRLGAFSPRTQRRTRWITGDSKLEGKANQIGGKVQNAIGGIKDTLRGR